jgi:ankyrin repeat protein
MYAAHNLQLNTMRSLINAGANLNLRSNIGETALMLALKIHGDDPFSLHASWYREIEESNFPKEASIEVTRLLIDSGAEYTLPNNMGFFTVDYAMVAKLMGVELPPELSPDHTHLDLCKSAMEDDSDKLAMILASENIPYRINTIALNIAAARGFEKCCALLLKNGADPNKANPYDYSPATSAAFDLNLPIIKLLLDHGLAKDELNVSLITACATLSTDRELELGQDLYDKERLEFARYLLEHGADPNQCVCGNNRYLLDNLMMFEENCDLVRLLLEFGALSRQEEENLNAL